MATRLRPESTELSFGHDSPTMQQNQNYQPYLYRELDEVDRQQRRHAAFGGKQQTKVYAGPGRVDPAGVGVLKEAEAQVQPKGYSGVLPSFRKGMANAPRGKAKLHKGEKVIDGDGQRTVRKTGVQTMKGGETVIPAQPVSRWNKIGPSMDDHLRKFGLI